MSALRASILAIAMCSVFVVSALAAQGTSTDPIVARVNNHEIRDSDLKIAERIIRSQNLKIPADDEQKKRKLLVDFIADMMLVIDFAKQNNGGKAIVDDDVDRAADYARKKLLMGTALAEASKSAVTDESLHAAYREVVEESNKQTETRLREIQFRFNGTKDLQGSAAAEEKAKSALERIRKGEDFATLAKELTENPLSKPSGGDLGYMGSDLLTFRGFQDAVSKLEVGQVSEPVRTVFGWHILKVEDRRQKSPPDFDKIRSQLEAYVVRKAELTAMTKLRSEAKIERLDKRADDHGAK
jgi:parvulin-like peptidyl-prolyl isomerase